MLKGDDNVPSGSAWWSPPSPRRLTTATALLDRHSQVALHFTPTYSPGLNEIELWFSELQRDVIVRGVITSIADPARELRPYLNAYSKYAKPFRWKYSQPLRRIRHGKTISATVH